MDRRVRFIKEKKSRQKKERQKTDIYLYKQFVFFAILGIIDWLFWHHQFLDLDAKYYLVFVLFPMLVGFAFYYFKSKPLVNYILDSKSGGFFDVLVSNLLMIISGVILSFVSFGVIGNVLFKLAMEVAVQNSQVVKESYNVLHFDRNGGRGFKPFSSLHYEDVKGDSKSFDIKKSSEDYARLKDLNEGEIEKKKLVLFTKEGFWNIKKIVGYSLE